MPSSYKVVTHTGTTVKAFPTKRAALAYSRKCNEAQFLSGRSRDLRTTVVDPTEAKQPKSKVRSKLEKILKKYK
jgi:hypothetical protein